jgi:hypothetical protein
VRHVGNDAQLPNRGRLLGRALRRITTPDIGADPTKRGAFEANGWCARTSKVGE